MVEKAKPKAKPNKVTATIYKQFFLGVALLVLTYFMLPNPYAVIPALPALYLLATANRRMRGFAVERKALKRLRLPDGWTIQHSHPVPGHGDIDILVTSPENERYAIEIKSQRKVRYMPSIFGIGGGIRYMGAKPPKCPVKQVIATAKIVGAHPIVWFPEADSHHVYKATKPEPHSVVFGRAGKLKRALGATNIFGF